MTYIAPTYDNINFTLSLGYTPPSATNINFKLDTKQTKSVVINDSFKGKVLDGTTVLSGTVIHLYKRSTGELVNSTVTTTSGTFAIPWVEVDEYYFIVALYPTTKYNALIYDYLYPTVSGS